MADAHATVDTNSIAFKLDVVACTATEAFIDAYYLALRRDRHLIDAFYCRTSTSAEGITVPSIAWNGKEFTEPNDFEDYINGLTYLNFEIDTLDCHVLNPKYLPANQLSGGSGDDDKDLERRMSFLVSVTGYVRLEEQGKGPLHPYSESFILVPNINQTADVLEDGSNSTKRDHDVKEWKGDWVIETQTFRFTGPTAENTTDQGGAKNETRRFGQAGEAKKKNPFANSLAAAGLLNKGKGKA